ncbi:LADA_0H08240g1_1 [Lachancea dasiensis]|uniref:LADA_0H08240g1_1 n=1 Tax=Lachancea dasiensis TaxID=1072105 RepID=A0A1G4K2G1_9SACH|nr:LADA_0H08240g1_1 [Lachancea dasiensis]
MLGLPKRYIRTLVILLFFLFPVAIVRFWVHWYDLGVRSSIRIAIKEGGIKDQDNLKLLDVFKNKDLKQKYVTSVGISTCLYVGNFGEFCPSFLRHLMSHGPKLFAQSELHTVRKDLSRSRKLRLAGTAHYLTYETVEVSELITFLSHSQETVFAVDGFRPQAEQAATSNPEFVFSLQSLTSDSVAQSDFVSEIDVLFGSDSVEPRLDWHMSKKSPLAVGKEPKFITMRKPSSLVKTLTQHRLQANEENTFKIVQLADLHFSVGEGKCRDEFPETDNCRADPKTVSFIEKVLDSEKPQLVVFTGDQIMGDECYLDSATALLKAVNSVISRRIPYAMVWGNHDDEGSLDRWQLSQFVEGLPYSLFKTSERDTKDNSFGVGNYMHYVYDKNDNPASVLYFLDAHKYSPNPKAYPGYDWIKEEQWSFMQGFENTLESQEDSLSMAFFHIPLPEYVNFRSKNSPDYDNPMIGNLKEGVTAPRYNSNGIKILRQLGVKITSVGHDHCNDYCLLDDSQSPANEDKIWLCFGGAAGEGGYAGYGGTERRIRVYQLDFSERSIVTWKVLNSSPTSPFDVQVLVNDGVPRTG